MSHVTKHSRSEQNDTTEGVVAALRELLSKHLKDLVKHNKHDQAHIDYKWQMLKDGGTLACFRPSNKNDSMQCRAAIHLEPSTDLTVCNGSAFRSWSRPRRLSARQDWLVSPLASPPQLEI